MVRVIRIVMFVVDDVVDGRLNRIAEGQIRGGGGPEERGELRPVALWNGLPACIHLGDQIRMLFYILRGGDVLEIVQQLESGKKSGDFGRTRNVHCDGRSPPGKFRFGQLAAGQIDEGDVILSGLPGRARADRLACQVLLEVIGFGQ